MMSRNALRGLASAASAARSPSFAASPKINENVARLGNGLTVASIDLSGAVSQLLFAFKAGSRYEQPDEKGLVHHLRNSIGTDSKHYLAIKLLWQSGSVGSTLISSASKDLVTIQMAVSRTNANIGLSLLGEFAQPAFKPWDTEDSSHTLTEDLVQQQPYDLVIENLHKAAYRNGSLANPLFAPVDRHGKISYKQLEAYSKSRLVASEAVLVGVNVEHSLLLHYASSQDSIAQGGSGGGKAPSSSPYIGGTVHQSGNTPLTHIAIGGPGGALNDEKSTAVAAVLSYVIGRGSNLKYPNAPAFGVVDKAVAKAANHGPVAVSAINVLHADAGLAGVYLTADGEKITPLVRAAVDGLRSIAQGVDVETLAIAKKFAQVDANVNATDSSVIANDRAAQIFATGSATSTADFISSIEAVTTDDIKKAAAKLVSKLSISAYGKVNQVPYVDEL